MIPAVQISRGSATQLTPRFTEGMSTSRKTTSLATAILTFLGSLFFTSLEGAFLLGALSFVGCYLLKSIDWSFLNLFQSAPSAPRIHHRRTVAVADVHRLPPIIDQRTRVSVGVGHAVPRHPFPRDRVPTASITPPRDMSPSRAPNQHSRNPSPVRATQHQAPVRGNERRLPPAPVLRERPTSSDPAQQRRVPVGRHSESRSTTGNRRRAPHSKGRTVTSTRAPVGTGTQRRRS